MVKGRERDITGTDRGDDDPRRQSPSAARNRGAVRDVLLQHLPDSGNVLEVGAGTGEHVVHFATNAPDIIWAPSDADSDARASIAAWTVEAGRGNILPPREIDVCTDDWAISELTPLSGVVSLNMIHIAPFAATEGLVKGAGRYLREGGVLFLYGPFSRNGQYTAPSNQVFDESLKSRDASWGVRDLERDIVPLTTSAGLVLKTVVAMPANNFSVIFTKDS